jgi:hypothetical protein
MEKRLTIHQISAALDRTDPFAFVPRTRPALADEIRGIPMGPPPPFRPIPSPNGGQLLPRTRGHLQLVRRAA